MRLMKPVFVSDSLGCLYQSGYRQLEKMPREKRAFFARDVGLVLSVSPHKASWIPGALEYHEPFGDNKQWVMPSQRLEAMIRMAAGTLEGGSNVLVYCYYGRNRSGLVAALIIRELLEVTGEEALRLLRRARRGSVGGNKHFVSYLEGLPTP